MSLLVAGALHWDVVVNAPRLPRLDETLRGSGVAYRFGGKGGNQAIAAARAGARTAFAGRVGGDDAGRAMRDELRRAGVEVSQLQEGPGASGMSVAIGVAGGDYAAVIVPGENHLIDADAIRLPSDCRILLMQNECAPGLFETLAPKARAAGVELWLNAAPSPGLGARQLRLADVVIANRVEAADILGVGAGMLSAGESLEALREMLPYATLVLTLGGDGVAFDAGEGLVRRAARRVSVVSTHGAGDVFVGTLAAARLDGQDWRPAVDTAQSAAARHVSQMR